MTELVEAARTFIGVRWKHRGRDRNGLDCAGLVWATYAYCGVILPDYRLYGREPYRDGLVRYVTAALGESVHVAPVTLEDLMPGDVLVMRFLREPHHMGIVGSRQYGEVSALTLVHADGDAPISPRVHEVRLTPDAVGRITHVFRSPI